jgi:chromosome segregation ATPase
MAKLKQDLEKQRIKTRKNEDLIKFLNQNNEDLESKLSEAVERELQLTGEMRELALGGERKKNESKKLKQLQKEISKLKNDLFEKNKELTGKLRLIGSYEEEVGGLKKQLEEVKREKFRVEMEGKDELEELKRLVDQIDFSEKTDQEEERQAALRQKERQLELREMKVNMREEQRTGGNGFEVSKARRGLEWLLNYEFKMSSRILKADSKIGRIGVRSL